MSREMYARPNLLAETDWLAEHMGDVDMCIVDCDPPDAYDRAHIPGAVNVGSNTYIKGDSGLHVIPPSEVADFMGNLGIGNNTVVVLYDGRGSTRAARFWWVLNYYGHNNSRILNGGWRKWLAEGKPVTDRVSHAPSAIFTPSVNASILVTGEELKANVNKAGVAIWDVRSLEEHIGVDSRGNKRSGCVPGATHLEWSKVVDLDGLMTFKPANEILEMFAAKGLTPDKQVYTY